MGNAKGYSLLELLIVVAIITIVTSIALPSYQQHVMRSHRGDAMAALLRVANQQEKFYLQNNTYTSTLSDLGIAGTEHGYYTLAISPADTNTFTATATVASGPQENDTDCNVFSINAAGTRTATKSPSGDNTSACWR